MGGHALPWYAVILRYPPLPSPLPTPHSPCAGPGRRHPGPVPTLPIAARAGAPDVTLPATPPFAARTGSARLHQTAPLTPPCRPEVVRPPRPARRRCRPLGRRRRDSVPGARLPGPRQGAHPPDPRDLLAAGASPRNPGGDFGGRGQHRGRAPVKPSAAAPHDPHAGRGA